MKTASDECRVTASVRRRRLLSNRENVAKAWKVSWYYSLNQFIVYVFEYMMVSGF